METLCKIRELQRSIAAYEASLIERFGISLNEGMLLCIISESKTPLSSGLIAEALGLTASNTSKVIASVEKKGLIERLLGNNDKRQMYFKLTGAGHGKLRAVTYGSKEVTGVLKEILTA